MFSFRHSLQSTLGGGLLFWQLPMSSPVLASKVANLYCVDFLKLEVNAFCPGSRDPSCRTFT